MTEIRYEVRHAVHPDDFARYGTQQIREHFLVQELFRPGLINLVYTGYDRFVVGGICPATTSLALETIPPFRSQFFLERREVGIINIGGPALVTVDGQQIELLHREALYIGRGYREVIFANAGKTPARLYLNSAPAHRDCPLKKVTLADADIAEAGDVQTANARTINKLIVNSRVDTCQVQMGLTVFKPGSVWNTMPVHTHGRRMETYLYFDIPGSQAVCHFMGQPQETRHIWVHNEEAVISPDWSLHSGAGTAGYAFIWGMAGENLDYGDMDVFQPNELL